MTNIEKALALINTFATTDTEKAASLLAEGYIRVQLPKLKQQLRIKEPKDRRHTGKRKILRTAVEHCENFLLSVVVLLHNGKKFIVNQLAVIGQYAALDGALKQLAVQFRF